MSQTYRSRIAANRLRPVHTNYRLQARVLLANPEAPGRHLTCCAHCGREGGLVATVRIGAKSLHEGVPVHPWGYRVPGGDGRLTEILILDCGHCGTTLEPAAYHSPEVFLAEYDAGQAILEGRLQPRESGLEYHAMQWYERMARSRRASPPQEEPPLEVEAPQEEDGEVGWDEWMGRYGMERYRF